MARKGGELNDTKEYWFTFFPLMLHNYIQISKQMIKVLSKIYRVFLNSHLHTFVPYRLTSQQEKNNIKNS